MPPTAAPPKVTNRYYQRTAGTPRPCFICYRESTTVLSTLNTTDFLYICPSHLSDRGFATLVSPPPLPAATPSTGPSKEEIAKVIADYERKKGKDASKGKDAPAVLVPDSTKTTEEPPKPTHPVYELHRVYWEMRLGEMKKRGDVSKAKAVSKELPRVPAGFGAIVRPRPGPDGGGIV